MPRWKFRYGWLRGCGSAAFVVGLVMSGQAIGHFGIVVIVWLNAALLLAASPVALGVPQLLASGGHSRATASQARGVLAFLRLPLYRNMVLLAALILGSHAMHDSFAMIRWSRAGISPGTSGILPAEPGARQKLHRAAVVPRMHAVVVVFDFVEP
jgi:PPP family 3-phenylpropionic acid transporter